MVDKTIRPMHVSMPSWGVSVLESHHASGFHMEPSQHDFLQAYYVLEGEGVVEKNSHRIPLRASDVVMLRVGQPHRLADSQDNPLSLYVICVDPEVYQFDPDLSHWTPPQRFPRNRLLTNQVRSILRQLIYEQTLARPGCAVMMRGLALRLLATLFRSTEATSKLPAHSSSADLESLVAVEAYVHELRTSFYEKSSLNDVARQLGISRRRFTQLFRELVGSSWHDHVQSLRIEHAKRLLLDTDHDVTSIAFDCGFGDLSGFYRAFKRATGSAPQRWRQQYNHNERKA